LAQIKILFSCLQIRFYFDEYERKIQLYSALTTAWEGGTTNAAEALRSMRENMFDEQRGDRPGVKNVGLVFLDGKTDDKDATWKEAIKNRDQGIEMLAVGIGGG
jgi:hypothetical protein